MIDVQTLGIQSLAVIGGLYLVAMAYSWYEKFKEFTPLGSYKFTPTKESWAVITGASDGIGREFALQAAAKKYNVVLLARTKSKLDEVAQLCEQNGVKAIVYPFDFSSRDPAKYAELKKMLDKLNVEILVNNVGVSHEMPISFLDETPEMVDMIMNVNVFSVMDITRVVLPGMVQRKKGLVLNMGSMSGKIGSPLLAVYGASKTYLKSWSRGTQILISYCIRIKG
jgi:17beta-estradiol 17-dehydrogenase / very-long-chain 3-oxoacyl-CoA reductase